MFATQKEMNKMIFFVEKIDFSILSAYFSIMIGLFQGHVFSLNPGLKEKFQSFEMPLGSKPAALDLIVSYQRFHVVSSRYKSKTF